MNTYGLNFLKIIHDKIGANVDDDEVQPYIWCGTTRVDFELKQIVTFMGKRLGNKPSPPQNTIMWKHNIYHQKLLSLLEISQLLIYFKFSIIFTPLNFKLLMI